MEFGKREVGHSAHFFVLVMSSIIQQTLTAKVVEIANRVGASVGIEIVDVELVGGGNNRVLRIYIDKAAGVTHSDCEVVSHEVSAILDAEDVIPGSYQLEVSSPGVERKLKTARDFERFQGKKARIQLRKPIENQKRWEGTLAGVTGGVILLEPSPGKQIQVPLDEVERANLKFEW
jgi:ribosome maturation factor RimP